jgi:hypothetical protein
VKNDICEIEALLTEHHRTGFPNPDRRGCPPEKFLRDLAKHRIPIDETAARLDHLSACSECFDDYLQFSTVEGRRRRRNLIALGSVAAILCVVLLGEYLMYRHGDSTAPGNNSIAKMSSSGSGMPADSSMILDLHNVATIRGQNHENHSVTTLTRGALELVIYLPPNSQPGSYTVQLLKQFTDTKALITVSGLAEIKDGHPVLRASADLRSVPAGSYYLALRHRKGGWRYYRVAVS